jgi:hypothetical protein
MRQFSQRGVIGLAAMFVVAVAANAFASEPPPPGIFAPEVSPASISTGLALLAGSVLLLRARRGRR